MAGEDNMNPEENLVEERSSTGMVRAPEEAQPRKGKKRDKTIASRDSTPVTEGQVARLAEGEVNFGSGKRRRSAASTQMTAPARTLPLLVCSIGNPGSTYANTLHSAGHTVVNKLAARLGYSQFSKDRSLGNGLVSRPAITGSNGDWTLWQSTSYMNESGKGVKVAFKAWSRGIPVGDEGRLVVIYDELEQPLGKVTVRTASGLSARGHNGLKSIMTAMPQTPLARIGIGIGRPMSRESDEVARYVLAKMKPAEREKIEGSVEEVVRKLRQLEKG